MSTTMNAMHLQAFGQSQATPVQGTDTERVAAGDVGRLEAIYVLNSLAIGGSERKTLRVANALAKRGVKLGIVCLNRPDTLLCELDKRVQVHFLERRGRFSPAAAARLRHIVTAARPKALIAVNSYPALYVAAAAAFLPDPRPRTVCLINTSATAGVRSWWQRLLYKAVLKRLDRTMHGCEAYRKTWCAPHSAAWQRSGTIYNGVDPEEFSPECLCEPRERSRALYGIGAEPFVIGTVGRLAREKNQAMLIEVLARLRWSGLNAHLLIVGDGPLRAALGERAVQLGVGSKVTFTGALSDVRPALAAMDVFVLPSTGVETFSNAVLEAMAMAKPVILSDVGGAAEMLVSGVEGFILPPHELGTRLPSLLMQFYADRRRLEAMGEAARARVIAKFSLSAMVDQHMALIH